MSINLDTIRAVDNAAFFKKAVQTEKSLKQKRDHKIESDYENEDLEFLKASGAIDILRARKSMISKYFPDTFLKIELPLYHTGFLHALMQGNLNKIAPSPARVLLRWDYGINQPKMDSLKRMFLFSNQISIAISRPQILYRTAGEFRGLMINGVFVGSPTISELEAYVDKKIIKPDVTKHEAFSKWSDFWIDNPMYVLRALLRDRNDQRHATIDFSWL